MGNLFQVWPDLVGAVGVILILAAYFFLQAGRLRSASVTYSALNAAGALLILVSLLHDFNLSAFIVEVFWALISLFGIFRALRARTLPA